MLLVQHDLFGKPVSAFSRSYLSARDRIGGGDGNQGDVRPDSTRKASWRRRTCKDKPDTSIFVIIASIAMAGGGLARTVSAGDRVLPQRGNVVQACGLSDPGATCLFQFCVNPYGRAIGPPDHGQTSQSTRECDQRRHQPIPVFHGHAPQCALSRNPVRPAIDFPSCELPSKSKFGPDCARLDRGNHLIRQSGYPLEDVQSSSAGRPPPQETG
jgi:hypothetical protein